MRKLALPVIKKCYIWQQTSSGSSSREAAAAALAAADIVDKAEAGRKQYVRSYGSVCACCVSRTSRRSSLWFLAASTN